MAGHIACGVCGKPVTGNIVPHHCAKCRKPLCGMCVKTKGGFLGLVGGEELCPYCHKHG